MGQFFSALRIVLRMNVVSSASILRRGLARIPLQAQPPFPLLASGINPYTATAAPPTELIDSRPGIWTSTTIPKLLVTHLAYQSFSLLLSSNTIYGRTRKYLEQKAIPSITRHRDGRYLPTYLHTYLPWISQINGICAWTKKTLSFRGIEGISWGLGLEYLGWS